MVAQALPLNVKGGVQQVEIYMGTQSYFGVQLLLLFLWLFLCLIAEQLEDSSMSNSFTNCLAIVIAHYTYQHVPCFVAIVDYINVQGKKFLKN